MDAFKGITTDDDIGKAGTVLKDEYRVFATSVLV